MLERHGLQVRAALLFDRPTPQQTEDGLADWIRMFDKAPFAGVSEELQETIIVRRWRHCAQCCTTMDAGMWIACASASSSQGGKINGF